MNIFSIALLGQSQVWHSSSMANPARSAGFQTCIPAKQLSLGSSFQLRIRLLMGFWGRGRGSSLVEDLQIGKGD